MKTPGDFKRYLQGIIDRHPQDLSIILKGLGIADEPTPDVLVLAYVRYGDALINLLAQLPESGSLGDQLKSLFEKGVSLVTASRTGSSQPAVTAPAPEQSTGTTTKKIVLIGGVAVVLLIVVFLIVKSFKQK